MEISKGSFFDSSLCQGKSRCEQCRTSRRYREGISALYEVPDIDFDCPFGMDSGRPSITDRAKSLSDAIADAALRTVDGEKVFSKNTEKEYRLEVCSSCRFYQEGEFPEGLCDKCGCVMQVKAGFAGSKCPIGKW